MYISCADECFAFQRKTVRRKLLLLYRTSFCRRKNTQITFFFFFFLFFCSALHKVSRGGGKFLTGVGAHLSWEFSALVKWLSHYIPPHTLSPILFPNKGSSVCVEMKICILFINNNGPLVATLRKSIFLAVCVPLAGCGARSEGAGKKKKREADAAPQTLQPDEVILPGCTRSTYAHITESGRAMAITASGFETSHALVHQAAGLYNFWSASSDVRFTPSVGSGQPQAVEVCLFCFSAVHYWGFNVFTFDLVMRAVHFTGKLVMVGRTVLDHMTWWNRRLQMGILESKKLNDELTKPVFKSLKIVQLTIQILKGIAQRGSANWSVINVAMIILLCSAHYWKKYICILFGE